VRLRDIATAAMNAGTKAMGPSEISPRAPAAPTRAQAQNHVHRTQCERPLDAGRTGYTFMSDASRQTVRPPNESDAPGLSALRDRPTARRCHAQTRSAQVLWARATTKRPNPNARIEFLVRVDRSQVRQAGSRADACWSRKAMAAARCMFGPSAAEG
jgi:hypothetical protein